MSNIGANQSSLKIIEHFLKEKMPGYEIERTEHKELERIRKEELEVFRISRKNIPVILVGFNRGYFEGSIDQPQLLNTLADCLLKVSSQQRLQYITVTQSNVEGPNFWPRMFYE